jgi:large subunit ribosomal protein L15
VELVGVNIGLLEQFADGTEITSELLRLAGLAKGARQGVKILGMGELTKKLTIKVQGITASAMTKVEQVGGTFEKVAPRVG